MELESFPALSQPGVRHAFSTRSSVPLDRLEAELIESFSRAGFALDCSAQAEQTHGNQVASVSEPSAARVPGVDALATGVAGLTLIVRVADCGPVYFFDPVRRVIALAHSGRKGTEGNIVGRTIAHLGAAFGSRPGDLIVQLGPCIRPPHYEIDFAAEIARQARAAGVAHFHDGGTCTAANLDRYYSYRAEKGKTGRMWAALMLE